MRRLLAAIATFAGLVLTVAPAGAHDSGWRGPGPSVFPQPHDPWRSWGVRRELPHHVRVPHHVHPGRTHGVIIATPAPAPVWVPGQWWWDGWRWQWAPGYWAAH